MLSAIKVWLIVDVVSLIPIYFIYCFPRWRENSYQLFVKTCMYIYICFVLYFTLIIPIIIPLPFINMSPSNIQIYLIPFNDIINGNSGITESVLNVIMLIPFGIMYPFIYRKSFSKTLSLAFIFILGIEIWQLVSARNLSSCDITDVITNMIGVTIGYAIYAILGKPTEQLLKKLFKTGLKRKYIISKKYKILFACCLAIQLFIRSITINLY